jgi:DNA-directed RNA polymerase subunit RPC12/RpoP
MRLKAQAVRAERAGRYEDAAKLYEELNFLSIARSLRERDRSSVLRHVQVDINRLLEQVRQGELVIPYKCPSCGAGIKITKETSTEGLAHCPYCGESLAIADVKDFLSSLL